MWAPDQATIYFDSMGSGVSLANNLVIVGDNTGLMENLNCIEFS